MSIRFMRIFVFFDLPMETSTERREYSHFRRFLIKEGFFMLQKSVYKKLVANANVAKRDIENIKENKPKSLGFIQALTVTETQYLKMETISGEFKTNYIDATDEVIFI